jgi:hypothetical protein
MKKYILPIALLLSCFATHAQDVDYKKGLIQVDGKDYAKLDVQKKNFGLTKDFEVFSMSGKKLIIAALASEFQKDKSDNSVMYYRLTFLTANQVGIFKVPALSQEKGFAKLIGNSGIIQGDTLNELKVKEFIAAKGASPVIAVDYTTVSRNHSWPVRIQEDKNIEQDGKIIGSFVPKGTLNGQSYYQFLLPSGVAVAEVSFAGGNNAQNTEVFTKKDNYKRVVPIPQKETIKLASAGVDQNYFTLVRIAKWLVDNQYL